MGKRSRGIEGKAQPEKTAGKDWSHLQQQVWMFLELCTLSFIKVWVCGLSPYVFSQ